MLTEEGGGALRAPGDESGGEGELADAKGGGLVAEEPKAVADEGAAEPPVPRPRPRLDSSSGLALALTPLGTCVPRGAVPKERCRKERMEPE